MIGGHIIGWCIIAFILFGAWCELREAAEKRSKLTPEQRRLQKLYARKQKQWQPHARRRYALRRKRKYDPAMQPFLF